jgi:N-acetylglucosaminyldiphosphoundecaprenol N-acetyl-beta-D-mannosaminyltransferase
MQHIENSVRPEPSGPPPSVRVLGVRVDRLTQQEALARIEGMLAPTSASIQSQLPPSCRQIITVNPEFVMAAQHNTAFRQCINQAALVLPDGIGVVLATRYLGQPAPERVTGVDTLVELARLCARGGHRLYLLGAAPGVAEIAAEKLQHLASGLQIAGTYAGSPAPEDEDEIIERLQAAQVDVLCVAYGAPAQDLWIYRNRARLPVAVALGVGGSFDFLAGRQRRAPGIMQKLGLEWLYRLYREPWRWRRMLALPRFALLVLARGRQASKKSGPDQKLGQS